jgi:hypothetical protein
MTDSLPATIRVQRKSLLLDRAIPAILILAAIVISTMRIGPDEHNGISQSLSILCSIFEGVLEVGLMVSAVTAYSRTFPGVLGTSRIAWPRMGAIVIAAGSVGAYIIALHNYDLTGLAIAIAVMLTLYILLIRILFAIGGAKLLLATAFLAVFEFASLIAMCGVKGINN